MLSTKNLGMAVYYFMKLLSMFAWRDYEKLLNLIVSGNSTDILVSYFPEVSIIGVYIERQLVSTSYVSM
jgi:hypothetical protein